MKAKKLTPTIAGILIGYYALSYLGDFASNLSDYGISGSLSSLLLCLAYTAVAIVLITKVRAKYAAAPFALLALAQLVCSSIKYYSMIREGMYSAYSDSVYDYLDDFGWGLYIADHLVLPIIMDLIFIIACIVLSLITAQTISSNSTKTNRLWFIPPLLIAIKCVLGTIITLSPFLYIVIIGVRSSESQSVQ